MSPKKQKKKTAKKKESAKITKQALPFWEKGKKIWKKGEDALFHFSITTLFPFLSRILKKHLTEISLLRVWHLLRFFGSLGLFFVVLGMIFWLHRDLALFRPINLYDEGVTLFGAKRFLEGEIPYRDFWTIYGPLKFPLLAWVFSIFGSSVFVARVFFFTVSLAAYALIFWILKRHGGIFFAVFSVLFLSCFGLFSLTPFFLAGIILAFSFFAQNPSGKKSPLVLGFLMGFLFLLRIDFGLLSGGAIFLAVSFLCLFRDQRLYFFPTIGRIAFAFFAVAIPPFLLLGNAGALPDFWAQSISFPLFGEYRILRELPWVSPDFSANASAFSVNFLTLSRDLGRIFFGVPFFIFAIFWIWTLGKEKKKFPREHFAENALIAIFTLGAFLYASHRADEGHFLFLNAIALVFLFHLLSFFPKKSSLFFFLPIVGVLAIYPAHNLFSEKKEIANTARAEYSFFPVPFPQNQENDDLQKTLNFFSGISPDEKVFVGTSDTSRVFVNNIVLPFLLQQNPATKYHELHTGIVTTAEVQNEMIDEMKTVKWAVLWDNFLCEENKSCLSSGVYLFDHFFQENFTPVAHFGEYHIFQKK